jgi:hypothetical protein
MRVLLDECLPRGLKRHLPGHDVRTVPEAGWAGMKNGALLFVSVAKPHSARSLRVRSAWLQVLGDSF